MREVSRLIVSAKNGLLELKVAKQEMKVSWQNQDFTWSIESEWAILIQQSSVDIGNSINGFDMVLSN